MDYCAFVQDLMPFRCVQSKEINISSVANMPKTTASHIIVGNVKDRDQKVVTSKREAGEVSDAVLHDHI
jgi:hypothetical protein